jgi:hypothetical protein
LFFSANFPVKSFLFCSSLQIFLSSLFCFVLLCQFSCQVFFLLVFTKLWLYSIKKVDSSDRKTICFLVRHKIPLKGKSHPFIFSDFTSPNSSNFPIPTTST